MDITSFIQQSLQEDIGQGDFTTLSTINKDQQGKAKLLVKENGVLAGVDLAKLIFQEVDSALNFQQFLNDSDKIKMVG